MKNLEEIVEGIQKKDDFLQFMDLLIEDLNNNSQTWENKNLKNYLEAIQSWVEDMDGYYLNKNLPVPENTNWKIFSQILVSAKIYE